MTKTRKIFVIGLLVLLFTAFGSAFAFTPLSLNGTTWTAPVTSVTSIQPNGTSTTSFGLEIKFTFQSGDFLSGTFTVVGPSVITSPTYYFSAILHGESLSIVAAPESGGSPTYIIHARIMEVFEHSWNGTPPSATMFVKGISFKDGSQFEGSLTEEPSS